jgi:hypothetical protein
LGKNPLGFGDFRQNWRTGGLGEQRSFAESAPAARDGRSTVARKGECASVKFRGSSPNDGGRSGDTSRFRFRFRFSRLGGLVRR